MNVTEDEPQPAPTTWGSAQPFAFLDSACDTILVFDTAGCCVYANTAALARLGARVQQLAGRGMAAILESHPQILAAWQQALAAVLAEGRAVTTRERWAAGEAVGERGERAVTESVLSPVRDAAGIITGVGIICRQAPDAADKAGAGPRAIEHGPAPHPGPQQRDVLWTLIESLDMVFWLTDARAGRYLYMSPRVEQVYGRPVEAFLADISLWKQVVHPDDRALVERGVEELFEHGSADQEYRIVWPDGQVRWLRDRKALIRDARGQVIAIGGVGADVTDRRQAVAALAESEQRFRTIFENNSDGILIADPQTRQLHSANPAACRMLGCEHDEIASLNVADLHPQGALPWVLDIFDRQSRGEIDVAADVPVRRRDGSTFHADITAFPITFNNHGYLVGCFKDVTQRRHAEQESRWYQQRLRSLALELTLAEERERRRVAEHLHDEVGQLLSLARIKLSDLHDTGVDQAAAEAAETLRDLLDRAIRASRSLMLQLSHPALYDLGLRAGAEGLIEEIERLYGLKVRFRAEPGLDVPDLRIRVILFQCLRELLINVARHGGVHRASVRMTTHGGAVRVVVRDRGEGFDAEQVDGRTGDGRFGLFSIRERLRNLGGRMRLRSQPGRGTTVVLEAPTAGGSAASIESS